MTGAAQLNVPGEVLAAIADRSEGHVPRGQGALARCRLQQSHPLVRGLVRPEKP
jgi:hypothetical protein